MALFLPKRTRQTARLIVLDDERRLLLFRYLDEHARPWWATPGGGLEGGESFEAAARREALEELGLAGVALSALWRDTATFEARGTMVEQIEQFFLLRVSCDGFELGESVRAAHEIEGILESRWWRPADIPGSVEPVFPEGLADRVRQALDA